MTTLANAHKALASLLLVCDRCGNVLRGKDMPIKEFTLIWQAAIDIGWIGVDRVGGPHYCPACADRDGLDAEQTMR